MDLLKIIPSATGHQGIVSMVLFGALRDFSLGRFLAKILYIKTTLPLYQYDVYSDFCRINSLRPMLCSTCSLPNLSYISKSKIFKTA